MLSLLRAHASQQPMVAERRALLSLHLHFVTQYKFFVIIIIAYNYQRKPTCFNRLLNMAHAYKTFFVCCQYYLIFDC